MTVHTKRNRTKREIMHIVLSYLQEHGPASSTRLIWILESNHKTSTAIFDELENSKAIRKVQVPPGSQYKFLYEITPEGIQMLQWMSEMSELMNQKYTV